MLADGLREASRVVMSSEGWLGLLWAIRASSTTSDNEIDVLSRVKIANFENRHVELGSAYVLSEIRTALSCSKQLYDQSWAKRLPTSIEIYARLLSRARQAGYDDEIALLVSMLSNERCMAGSAAHQPISTLLKNLFNVIGNRALIEYMPNLFVLPIRPHERLPEPADHWPIKQSFPITLSKRGCSELQGTLTFLIKQSESADKGVRAIALRRIMILHSFNLLDVEAQAHVARIVWDAEFCDANGWPVGNLYPWAYFSLPEPRKGYRSEAFHRKFLAETVELNDFSLRAIGTSSWVAKQNQIPLRFDQTEIARMARVVDEWAICQPVASNSRLAQFLNHEDGPDLTAVHGLTFLLLDLTLSEDLATRVWRKLELLESRDPYLVMQVFPRLLLSAPNRWTDTANKIRSAMHSKDARVCLSSCHALWVWCELTELYENVPRPPLDLLAELGEAIESSRIPILIPALEFAAHIMAKGPVWVRDVLANSLHQGLEVLRGLSTYDREPDETRDIPRIRRAIAKVVASVSVAYLDAPSIFHEWREALANDPLRFPRNLIFQR